MAGAGTNGVAAPSERSLVDAFKQRIKPFPWSRLLDEIPNPPSDYTPEEQVSRLVIGLLRTMERHHSEFTEDRIAECKVEEEFVDEDDTGGMAPAVRLRKLRNIKIRCFGDLKEARENHRIMAQEVREVSQEFLTSKTRKRKTDDREATEDTSAEEISKRKKLDPKPVGTTSTNGPSVFAQDVSKPAIPPTNGVEKPAPPMFSSTISSASPFSFAPKAATSTAPAPEPVKAVEAATTLTEAASTNRTAKEAAAENVFSLSKSGPAPSLQSPTLTFEPKADLKPVPAFNFGAAKPAFSLGEASAKPAEAPKALFSFGSTTQDATKTDPPKTPFSFGNTATPAPTAEKSAAEAPKPVFSFGSTTTKPAEPLTNISGNAGSPFAFGQKPDAAPKEPTAAPKFSFGASQASSEPAKPASSPFSFGSSTAAGGLATSEPAKASPFSFGASTGTTGPASAEPAKSSPFSFGASTAATNAAAAEPAKASPFTFGASTSASTAGDAAKEPAKPSFVFGGGPAPSSETAIEPVKTPFSFGATSSEPVKASPFQFGSTAPAAAPSITSNGSKSPFTFGASAPAPAAASATPAAPSAFNFGASQTNPSFSFGAQPAAPAAAPPAPAANPSFSFGAQNNTTNSFTTNQAPPFAFGQSTPTAAPQTGSFTFGGNQNTSFASSTKSKRSFDSTETEQAASQAPPPGQRKILKPRGFKGASKGSTGSTGSAGGSFQFLAPPSNNFDAGNSNSFGQSSGAQQDEMMDSPAKRTRPFGNDDMMDSSPAKKPQRDPDAMEDSPVKKRQASTFSFGQSTSALGQSTVANPFSFGAPAQASTPASAFPAPSSFSFGTPASTAAATPAATATASTSLFGAPMTTPIQAKAPAAPATGLFSSSATNSPLFGATKPADKPAQSPATSSLFGAKPSPFTSSTSSPQPAAKSLFGTPPSSLFKIGDSASKPAEDAAKPQAFGSLFGSTKSTPLNGLFGSKPSEEKAKESTVTESKAEVAEKPAESEKPAVTSAPAEAPKAAASLFNFGKSGTTTPTAAPTPPGTSIFSNLQKPLPSFSFPSVPANADKDDDDKEDEKEEPAPKPASIFAATTNSPFSFLTKPTSAASSAASTPADSTPFSNISAPQTVATRFLNLPDFNSGMSSAASTPAAATDTGGETDVASDAEVVPGQQPEDVKQIDLMAARPGEEDETLEFEIRSKALAKEKNDSGTEEWKVQGLGPLRVLKDKESGKGRILLRAEPSGKVIINSSIVGSDHKNSGSQLQILAPAPGAPSKLCAWVIRVKTAADAEQLANVLNELKPST